ncbi:hypothetical protein [Paenibacillus cremeus]|uniref:Uncharacterized protein n=1 Tax=Paenibacillus cremeus TaxID=2163881 RepID=A0A559JEU3_9BACL|nr:hypothetical protein [Paenibacillus cremeus]TVX98377.1 hypothetical protein FPZ49_34615 [Paenibacillus cremeus]
MARQKAKKTLLQQLMKTFHSLTAPSPVQKKTKRRKTKSTSTKKTDTVESSSVTVQDLHKKLDQELTQKLDESLKKIKIEMEQEILKKLTNTGKNDESDTNIKSNRSTAKKNTSKKDTKIKFVPNSDCTLLKLLTLSDDLDHTVVVGYELLDNSTQEIWGVDINEGVRLARNKKILNTKVKSRKIGEERQYFLAHVTDEGLYYSDEYNKSVLKKGKMTVGKYTPGLATAVKYAYNSGFRNNSKLPKLT